CEALTGGGTTFADGRKVCTSCQQSAVVAMPNAQGMAGLVNAFFAKRGYPLQADLPISLVQPGDLPKDTRGQRQLGLIIKKIRTQNGKEHSRSVERIKLLTGMPAEKFCEVYAHEYGHAWMLHAGYPKLPLLAEEGIAQIFSHLWLSERGTIFSSVLKSMVERNTDEIYGTGLRQALTGLRTLGLTGLLAYVKTNRQLPTTD
ncbi:MAG: protein DA1, partial [Proteobacteria bacterium]|nr:protein DA1 [Pseudomonadota bacterium]